MSEGHGYPLVDVMDIISCIFIFEQVVDECCHFKLLKIWWLFIFFILSFPFCFVHNYGLHTIINIFVFIV